MGDGFKIQRIYSAVENTNMYYDEGNEYVEKTGGWIEGYTVGQGSFAKNADHLYIYAVNTSTGNSKRGYITYTEIDLTDINTLYIDWEQLKSDADTRSAFVISTDPASGDEVYTARSYITAGFSRQINPIDVSAISGNFYIKLYARVSTSVLGSSNASELKVFKVWGE